MTVVIENTSKEILSIDLGGTKLLAACVNDDGVKNHVKSSIPRDLISGESDRFLNYLYDTCDQIWVNSIDGISIGIPGLLDMQTGVVIEAINLPTLDGVAIREQLHARYKVPVTVHNDANCFTFGAMHLSDSIGKNVVGLCLGTGLGSGLCINGRLYTGSHSCAGEFGSFPYLGGMTEQYCSGQFFKLYGVDGELTYQKALAGDTEALALFNQLGRHLAYAIANIVIAFDPDVILFGGSVSRGYRFFIEALNANLVQLIHPLLFKSLEIKLCDNPNAALIGSFHLFTQEHG